MSPEARNRWFLEQMMIRFTTLGVPVDQAARELAEIEQHLDESAGDPFELFGDPQALATSLVPPQQIRGLQAANLRTDIAVGLLIAPVVFAGLQLALRFFDGPITRLPWMVVVYLLISLFTVGQVAFSSIAMGVADGDGSLRLRGVSKACLGAFVGLALVTVLLVAAGADLSGRSPFRPSVWFWVLFGAVPAAAALGYAIRSWRLKKQNVRPIESGITGQILHEMNSNGWGEGWVRFGPNGEDLRDPEWSIVGTFKAAFRGVPE